MLNKTTNASFLKYGSIASSHTLANNKPIESDNFHVTQRPIIDMYKHNNNTIIHCISGIVLICVSFDLDNDMIHQFALHGTINLNKNVWFNFISLTPSSEVEIKFYQSNHVIETRIAMPFEIDRIITNFNVSEIYAYYYSIKGKNYHFDGETHPYYEFTFVDNGKLTTNSANEEITINTYEAIIYDRNTYHSQKNIANETCTFLTIMFQMDGISPTNILNKKLTVSRDEYDLINNFIKYTESQSHSRNAIILSLFNTIIMSLSATDKVFKNKPTSPVNQHYESELLSSMIKYVNEKIYEPINVDDLCDVFSVSRSTIQNLFKNNLKISPKKYINDVKLSKAKLLIRQNSYTISEISIILGYNSIHYFSRKFSSQFNISPSEYAKQSYKK
jgi:AraC-like DNA-binding protein